MLTQEFEDAWNDVSTSKEFESLQLLRKCQINLLTSEFTLSEKRLIASKYVSEEVLKELSDECIQVYDCFPLLCRMSKTWEASKALSFLLNPLSVFENELEQMKRREKLNFCALLLVTIFNNNFDNGLLTDDIDINDRKTLDDILEECGETRGTSRVLIKDHLDTLIGVYLMFEDNSYRFTNERLFEMTFTFMAKTFLKFMIKHCKVSMLCDKFGLECLDEGRQHYHFFVPSHFENYFFERLLKEADTYNFLDIFDCQQMTDKKYRAQFLAFCKTFDSEEINRIMELSYFGINLLHLISKRGYIDFAAFCLGKGVDINKYDDIGMTPLHKACKYENVNLVVFLLKAGVSVNSYKSRGFTALFGACMSEKIHVVKHLLENRADPDLCSGRRLIPLLLVSEKGYFEIAKLLIQFGADINQQDIMGFTALHHACIKGHEKIVELLLEKGANVDKSSDDGETPLHFACASSSKNVIQLLVAKRANLLALSRKSGLSPLRLLYRDQRDILIILLQTATLNDDINPIFLYALEENDQDLLEIIMEIDLEINRYLKSGKSALQIACQNGDLEIANVLIENKANVNICTKQGETVMQLSCLSENCDLVKLLITKGADIVDYKQSIDLPSPLHIGCLLNNYEMCSIFLQKDICIDVNASEKLTLHAAYSIRSPDYINSLLTKVGQWHDTCVTPFEIACFEQNVDIMELLLNSGAEPNRCFGTESFPLSVACILKNESMVEVLLNNHSNVNTATCIDDICLTIFQCEDAVDIIEIIAYKRFNYLNTPEFPISALHIASICSNENIVKMLLDSKARIHLKCSVNPVMLQILANNCQSTYRPEIAFKKYFDCSIIHDILPLHIACLMGNDNIVKMLLRSNIANLPNYIDSPILINTEQVICIHGLLVDCDLVSGEEQTFMLSPIQIACFSAHWTILKTLLKHGASIFESCRISNTILAGFSKNMKELQNTEIDGTVFKTSVEMFLFETFVKSCIIGDIHTIRDLLVIIQDTSIIHQNKAPIHYACESNQAEVVELLMSNNASVNCRTVDFDTPIHIATRNECTHILELLIKNGGDPFLTNRDGENALHIACMTNNMACLHLLLQSDESVFIGGLIQEYMDIKSSSGMTPLSIAYDNRNKEMLKVLILKGADIDKRYGPQKETLLFKACKDRENDILMEDMELLDKLITTGTNIDSINAYGETPLLIAVSKQNVNMIHKLLDAHASINLPSTVYGQGVQNLFEKTSIERMKNVVPVHLACLRNNEEIGIQ
ncbi:ankyrin-1-like [Mytilus trossulus]|uniref:ankyrin-1-like n=1 Tax=Mytilus trossulus TaxID=6551 RepID=UPI0030050049